MKCPKCNEILKFIESFSYDDYMIEGNGMISVYKCKSDNCEVDEIYIFEPF